MNKFVNDLEQKLKMTHEKMAKNENESELKFKEKDYNNS